MPDNSTTPKTRGRRNDLTWREHRAVLRLIERGVPQTVIAFAFGKHEQTIGDYKKREVVIPPDEA